MLCVVIGAPYKIDVEYRRKIISLNGQNNTKYLKKPNEVE